MDEKWWEKPTIVELPKAKQEEEEKVVYSEIPLQGKDQILQELPMEIRQTVDLEEQQKQFQQYATTPSEELAFEVDENLAHFVHNQLKGGWSCPVCTFLNHEELTVCEICETPQQSTKNINESKQFSSSTLISSALAKNKQANKTSASFYDKIPFGGLFSTVGKSTTGRTNELAANEVYDDDVTPPLSPVEKPQLKQGTQSRKSFFENANATFNRYYESSMKAIFDDALEEQASQPYVIDFPSPACNLELAVLRGHLKSRCVAGDTVYELLLERLFRAFFDEGNVKKTYNRIGDGWLEMGFQRNNPDTDFRGGGMLALKCLVYFSEMHQTIMKQIMIEQSPGKNSKWYPVCVAGINLTCMLSGMLKLGDGSFSQTRARFWEVFKEPFAFYEIFSIAMVIMNSRWHQLDASYMGFSGHLFPKDHFHELKEFIDVLKATRKEIINIFKSAPNNVEEVKQLVNWPDLTRSFYDSKRHRRKTSLR